MTSCKHNTLVLRPQKKDRRRCQHCHLTIAAHELGNGYCPECYESQGKRRYDFEDVAVAETETTIYRCEKCGAVIEC